MSISLNLVNLHEHTIHEPWIQVVCFFKLPTPVTVNALVLSASAGPWEGAYLVLVWRGWFAIYRAGYDTTLTLQRLLGVPPPVPWMAGEIHYSRARDTAVDDRRACPHTARTERWAIACCDSQSYSALIPLVPLVLQRQPVLLVALLWHSLLVAWWGMNGQATQICLETGVSGWKDTGASGWPELCISVAQQLLYMSMTAAYLAQFYHFYLLSSRGLFS